jgi:hypothetical protein
MNRIAAKSLEHEAKLEDIPPVNLQQNREYMRCRDRREGHLLEGLDPEWHGGSACSSHIDYMMNAMEGTLDHFCRKVRLVLYRARKRNNGKSESYCRRQSIRRWMRAGTAVQPTSLF